MPNRALRQYPPTMPLQMKMSGTNLETYISSNWKIKNYEESLFTRLNEEGLLISSSFCYLKCVFPTMSRLQIHVIHKQRLLYHVLYF